VRQVVYLPELYEDAVSKKYVKKYLFQLVGSFNYTIISTLTVYL